MAARNIETKARNTSRSGAFAAGTGLAAPANDQDAGGANLSKPYPTQSGGTAFNKGRFSGGKEVHHNGGQVSIKSGSTEPPR
jgi:hypothetical protein